jgi:hypothetical protein
MRPIGLRIVPENRQGFPRGATQTAVIRCVANSANCTTVGVLGRTERNGLRQGVTIAAA